MGTVLCLSCLEMAPTEQRPLLKDSCGHNNDYVGGVDPPIAYITSANVM